MHSRAGSCQGSGSFWSHTLSRGPDATRGDRLAAHQGPRAGASLFRGFPPGSTTLCWRAPLQGVEGPVARSRQSALSLGSLLDGCHHPPRGLSAFRLPCLTAVRRTARRLGSGHSPLSLRRKQRLRGRRLHFLRLSGGEFHAGCRVPREGSALFQRVRADQGFICPRSGLARAGPWDKARTCPASPASPRTPARPQPGWTGLNPGPGLRVGGGDPERSVHLGPVSCVMFKISRQF